MIYYMSRNIKWNYETCYKEALKYGRRIDFQKGNGSAYKAARENEWLDEYIWFKKPHMRDKRYKTYDEVYNIALAYNTRWDFCKGNQTAYNTARENDWLDDYAWFERPTNIYSDKKDNVYAYFFNDFKSVYVGRSVAIKQRDNNHRKSSKSTVFKYAESNNIPIPQMTILKTNLTPIEGLEWEDYFVKYYTEEGWNVLNIAKTGVSCGALGNIKPKWTYKKCYKEAKKYKTRWEFGKNNTSAYAASIANEWIEDYTWFKTPDKLPKQTLQLSLDNEVVGFYNGTREASRKTNIKQQNISACCVGKTKKSGGFKWQFVDDYLADWWEDVMEEITF